MSIPIQKATSENSISLTLRERQILQYADEHDATSKEIASALGIEKRTVEFHIANVFRKMGVKRRQSAIKMAKALGLL
jgi:DNA-binding CsgD family transcriptional regulator